MLEQAQTIIQAFLRLWPLGCGRGDLKKSGCGDQKPQVLRVKKADLRFC
jgi:hypothetical protein